MKLNDILTPSFRRMGRELGLKTEMFEGHLVVIAPMWRRALSAESQFCRAVVANGFLTERQMHRAVWRYRLGATRSGGVIFWQIDQEERIHDGKVMWYRGDCHRDKTRNPNWVGAMLQGRYRWADHPGTTHCLFGLHLLMEDVRGKRADVNISIAVVEAEKTAVIMSERYRQCLWMATGGLGGVQAEKFRPLRGRKVILFPDTDSEGKTYRRWYEAAQEVNRQPWWEGSPPVMVSPILEQHATEVQKAAKIDIADLIIMKREESQRS